MIVELRDELTIFVAQYSVSLAFTQHQLLQCVPTYIQNDNFISFESQLFQGTFIFYYYHTYERVRVVTEGLD